MNLIVAVDSNWGIGKGNGLLASLPGDMKYFKEKTTGRVVVMGRKTLESMPGKKGLPNRTNIVLTSNSEYSAERAVTVVGEEALLEELKKYDSEDVFIIGGGSIYSKYYKLCDKCYVTKIDAEFDADTFMPNLDEDDDYAITWQSEKQHENGFDYTFCLYERVKDR